MPMFTPYFSYKKEYLFYMINYVHSISCPWVSNARTNFIRTGRIIMGGSKECLGKTQSIQIEIQNKMLTRRNLAKQLDIDNQGFLR